MTHSFIAIKGNHLHNQELFGFFNYDDLQQDLRFTHWQQMDDFLQDNYFEYANKGITIRGIWHNKDWTIISDPETVDVWETDALAVLSAQLATTVLTFSWQTSSGTYGFSCYDKGLLKRSFLISDNVMDESLHSPLAEEANLTLDLNTTEATLQQLASNFGIQLLGDDEATYTVKQLSPDPSLQEKLNNFQSANAVSEKPAKKWWRLW